MAFLRVWSYLVKIPDFSKNIKYKSKRVFYFIKNKLEINAYFKMRLLLSCKHSKKCPRSRKKEKMC